MGHGPANQGGPRGNIFPDIREKTTKTSRGKGPLTPTDDKIHHTVEKGKRSPLEKTTTGGGAQGRRDKGNNHYTGVRQGRWGRGGSRGQRFPRAGREGRTAKLPMRLKKKGEKLAKAKRERIQKNQLTIKPEKAPEKRVKCAPNGSG